MPDIVAGDYNGRHGFKTSNQIYGFCTIRF